MATSKLAESEVVRLVLEVADNLRPADLAELMATTEMSPRTALIASWAASTVSWFILDRHGSPIGIFGVAPHLTPGLGVVWLMGTKGVEREAVSVARQTRPFLDEMQRLFPVLWNHVDARNTLSLRWLEWAGFRITDAHLHHGPERRLFFEFARTS